MRIKNSLFNIITNLLTIVVQTVLVFAVRMIFVKVLNEQYLGIQGLFTNIISMLSLAELGITTAICFSLYKPLANNDTLEISKIVTLFKKIYIFIGIIVIIAGVILLPFLKYFATGYSMGNLEWIFIIYLLTLAFEYFLSYREVLITADQKRYKIAYINLFSLIAINVLQVFFLIMTKNFIIYILIELIMRTIKYLIINLYIKKQYKNINFNCREKIGNVTKKNIIVNAKSLVLYKLGDYFINGTDNIIISKVINISTVGIYGNYYSIVAIFKNILNSITMGITSSFGNLVIKESEKTQENVFDIMNYVSFVFVGYATICFINLFNPFIEICFGTKYLLDFPTIIIICINFYLVSMLLPLDSVKSAAGLYYKDRYVVIIQSIINLIASIILAYELGLIGVLIGTTVSYLFVPTWQRPYIIYKEIFKSSVKKYYINYVIQVLLIVAMGVTTIIGFKLFELESSILTLAIILFICTITYLIFILLYSYKKKEFRYIIDLVKHKVGDK